MRELIVVAEHGDEWKGRCSASLAPHTGPGGRHVAYVTTEEAGPVWPTGKLLWAVREFPEFDRFLLMQDSMTLTADPLPWFREQWPGSGAVAWQRFPMQWDNEAQRQAVEERYTSRPSHGIFGPIFYTDRASLDRLEALDLLPETPHDRLSANATERAWAYAFEQADMSVVGPEWRPDLLTAGEPFGPFAKTLANRDPLEKP